MGQILAARLLRSEDLWGPTAIFGYVDRWMTEDDTCHVAAIYEQTGWDYSAGWQRQGQAWDAFVNNMWAAYRDRVSLIFYDNFDSGDTVMWSGERE